MLGYEKRCVWYNYYSVFLNTVAFEYKFICEIKLNEKHLFRIQCSNTRILLAQNLFMFYHMMRCAFSSQYVM
jgi:hypothetical protein